MREILFKAKRIDNGEWVEGCLVIDHSRSNLFEYRMQPVESGVLYAPPIYPETLCQFTGLYDKNDKRIWENDIVNTDSNVRAQIKFGLYSNSFSTWKRNQGFYMDFMNKEYYRSDLGYWAKKTVVIGNIFDNPELAKEE
nr:MAG TPA: YopX protein [Caudoviricetes sp.]